MKMLLFAVFTANALYAQPFPRARPEEVGMSTIRLDRLQAAIRTAVDSSEFAGIVVLVMRDGKLVAVDTAGYQDAALRIPMGADAIFRIASMTKAITSTGVLTLVEDGKIVLSDPSMMPAFL